MIRYNIRDDYGQHILVAFLFIVSSFGVASLGYDGFINNAYFSVGITAAAVTGIYNLVGWYLLKNRGSKIGTRLHHFVTNNGIYGGLLMLHIFIGVYLAIVSWGMRNYGENFTDAVWMTNMAYGIYATGVCVMSIVATMVVNTFVKVPKSVIYR